MSLNILIAEDNEFTAIQYNRILEKQGHNVVVTKDGEECLKKYNEQKKKNQGKVTGKGPFDLVVLDQSMPKKTGKEVASEILKSVPNQRIIFASAYTLGSKRDASEEVDENVEYLQKPFSLTKFLREVGN